MGKIRVSMGSISLDGDLFETETAKSIEGVLPIETAPDEWGDELYFEIPVEAALDNTATAKVRVGDIGYWPPGNALAIFFGPTPLSSGEDPVPASEVNIVGRIHGDASVLKQVRGARKIRIDRIL